VAPLKLTALTSSGQRLPSFHAYKSVAPLKPVAREELSGSAIVSTLTKAWPH